MAQYAVSISFVINDPDGEYQSADDLKQDITETYQASAILEGAQDDIKDLQVSVVLKEEDNG